MKRRYDLDWLRVFAFALLMLFHTGMLFSTWNWHVKNLETSEGFDAVMRFLHQWRMPLLFFISGSAVWFAMDRYSSWQFFLERHKRLLLPLVAGMLIVIPPQVYYERLYHEQFYDSFWDFYRTLFTSGSYPDGNLSWHHLWYIPYIWVYSMLAFPLFLGLRTAMGRRGLAALMNCLARPWALLWVVVPSAVVEIWLRPYWPDDTNNLTADWGNFTHKLTFFLAGFAFASSPPVYDTLARRRRQFLLGGIAMLAVLEPIWLWDAYHPPAAGYRLATNLHIWLWLFAALGYGRQYLSFNHPVLRYANEAVYPFYILHQTIIIILGYYLVPVDWGIGLKFCAVVAGMALSMTALYVGAIRPWNVMRVLFGMKWSRAKGSDPALQPSAPLSPATPQPARNAFAALAKRVAGPAPVAGVALALALAGGLALSFGGGHGGKLLARDFPAPSLAGNRLGVPTRQRLAIYLPPSYRVGDRHYPVLYYLPNFRNFLWQYTGGDYQKFRLRAAMDEVIAEGANREMIVVIPNATHGLGGGFYRNSPLLGNWEDYVTRDVVGYLDSHYRTIPEARGRGLAGNGAGGAGALEIALKHPDLFGCVGVLSPSVFGPAGARDLGLPNERLSLAWRAQLQEWQGLSEPDRHRRVRDFLRPLVFSSSRHRFFDGLRIVYAAAMTPDLAQPYPHIAFPSPAADLSANASLLAAYDNGWGGWPGKITRYLAQDRRLRRVILEYAKDDENTWIPPGTEALARALREQGVACQLLRGEGRHESRLGSRLKGVMLPAMAKALNSQL
jgi:glucans biosynthesis protein C